jgi:hypothetical protein
MAIEALMRRFSRQLAADLVVTMGTVLATMALGIGLVLGMG